MFVLATEFSSQGNISLRGIYGIKNATFVQFPDGSELTSKGSMNVNKSDYWDNYNTANSTQMENSGGTLNILVSWLESLFYVKTANIDHSNYNITNDYSFVNQINISNPPVECLSDTFMTRFLGTTSTCEAITNIANGVQITTENITSTNQATVENLTINDGINGNFIIRGNVTIIGNLTISDS